MAYRWKSTNRGCLKVKQGKRGVNPTIVSPGGEIPAEYVGEELLKRFSDRIEEIEKVIRKPVPKPKGEKK